MKRGRAAPQPSPRTATGSPPAAAAPATGPMFALVALAAAAAVTFAVCYRFFDYDLWEHLVVGKYLWIAHRIPTTQLWTWPTWGEPALVPSWAFRLLLWPFWSAGGETGLAVWRILLALLAGGFAFVAARRRGADPYVALTVIVLGALAWRGRTRVRPEALAFVLFAAQLALLAAGNGRKRLRDAGLVAIALLWINVHLSFYLGFTNLAFHALGETSRPERRRLLLVGFVALAVSFANPFGWQGVLQPLDIFFHEGGEPIYASVTELGSLDPRVDLGNGLLLLLVAWPVLLVLRARRRGLDWTEALTCALLAAQTFFAQRFRGFYVLAAGIWIARDLTELLAAPPGKASPAVPRRPVVTLVAIAALVAWMKWGQPEFTPGTGLDWSHFPVRACDFIADHGIRGRAFNHFWYGGYMEYRFWPDRGRLPFIDGHLESGRQRDRTLYTLAQNDRSAWDQLDGERHFDFALLDLRAPATPLGEFIESDSTWSAVFIDDAAVLFVRRAGALRPVADRFAYRRLRVAPAALDSVMSLCAADSTVRGEVRRELERQVAESPWTAVAHDLLASLDDMEGRTEDAGEERARAEAARRTRAKPGLNAPAEAGR